jgi:hypothetical protein
VIDQGQLVAEGFEALPPADLLGGIEVVQASGFNRYYELVEVVVEFVEERIQR